MGFLDRILGRHRRSSSQVAKDRLFLVLVHDRVSISAATLQQMKDELIAVISRYVEIGPEGVEVTFTQSKRESKLVANIPVAGPVKRPQTQRAASRSGARGSG
jgi:cell division topological specificity factor